MPTGTCDGPLLAQVPRAVRHPADAGAHVRHGAMKCKAVRTIDQDRRSLKEAGGWEAPKLAL
eukprot:1258959-Pyramimonas_sp.AAC.2